jgi:hypothetical protein
MIKLMTLTPYRDELVSAEVGDQYGRYLVSYSTEFRRVEVHFFAAPDGTLVVYVTKSPGVPVGEAHNVAHEASALYATSHHPSAAPPHVIYDGYGMGRSGSI